MKDGLVRTGLLSVLIGLLPFAVNSKTLYQCGSEQGGFELSSEPCKPGPATSSTSKPSTSKPPTSKPPTGKPGRPGPAERTHSRPDVPPGVFPQDENAAQEFQNDLPTDADDQGYPPPVEESRPTPAPSGGPSAPSGGEKKKPPVDKKETAQRKKADDDIKKARELSGLANRLMVEGNNAGAITSLEGAWRLYPKNPFILLNLGVAHNRNGDWSQARKYYRQAMEFEYRKKAREGTETRITNPHSTNYGKPLLNVILDSWDKGQEREAVFYLKGNPVKGKEIYDSFCANKCHQSHGWGTTNGEYPQISGQHASVLIREMLNMAEKNRDAPVMDKFVQVDTLGGEQAMADVAAYIARLPMTPFHGQGPGTDLVLGKNLYQEHCERCHGPKGEGDGTRVLPRIQGQHYQYMVRQYEGMRHNQRRNIHPLKAMQIQDVSEGHILGILDYVSRLLVDVDLLAPNPAAGKREPQESNVPKGAKGPESGAVPTGTDKNEAKGVKPVGTGAGPTGTAEHVGNAGAGQGQAGKVSSGVIKEEEIVPHHPPGPP
ncbi:MAG: c-type cytochrome [Magnetococcus sp. DMHC-1]